MKTTRIVSFLMVLAILWCADVFAHMYPDAHFCPGTPTNDPCEEKSCDVNPDDDPENIYVGGHGHITDYKGKGEPGDDGYQHGQDRATRWGYWTKGGYEAVPDKEGDDSNLGCVGGTSNNNTTNTTITITTPPPPPPNNNNNNNNTSTTSATTSASTTASATAARILHKGGN